MKPSSRVAKPRLILGFILVCALIGLTGFIIGKTSSSNQEEALASAQTSIDVYAAAEIRTLGGTAVFNGTVRNPQAQDITYAGSGVVTTVNIEAGDTVTPGTIIATVDSNPVIATLGSDKPIYRDLHPGDSGYDVEATQEILNQLGYRVAVTGTFDEATEKTAERFFANIGFTSPCGEKICFLTGTFLKIPQAQMPVASVIGAGTNTAENPVLFSSQSGNKSVQARISVAQKAEFEGQPEATVSGSAGQLVSTADYSFSEFKEAQGNELPGYDLTIDLPQDLENLPDDKTPVTISLNSQAKEYLAVPAVAIRQEGTSTYLVTEDGSRVEVEVLAQVQGWAGLADNPAISPGTKVLVS